jgi:hypothetical protein
MTFVAKIDAENPLWAGWEIQGPLTVDETGYPVSALLVFKDEQGDQTDECVCPIIDHLMIDPDSGEVIGMVTKEGFDASTEEGANWVLKPMAEHKAKAEYWDQQPDVVVARQVIANAERLAKAELSRLRYLDWRFKAELGKFVQGLIDGKKIKTKTWVSLWGTISRKKKAASVKVADEALAIAWAKDANPDAVETKEQFYISKLQKSDKEWLINAAQSGEDEQVAKAFTYEPEEENTEIKQGAKL